MDLSDSLVWLQVRPNDLDVQGHVNNAVTLEYFEAGRWDWFARNGLAPDGAVAPVVARAEVDYLAPIPYARIEVATRLAAPQDPRAGEGRTYRTRFRQEIRIPGQARPAARVLVTIAFVDRGLGGRPVSLREFRECAGRREAPAVGAAAGPARTR